MSTPAAAIRVRALRKSYGAHEAVRGIEFDVRLGEVFGLLGPNGAGKTTTVEILEGYRERDGGDRASKPLHRGAQRVRRCARSELVPDEHLAAEQLGDRLRGLHRAPQWARHDVARRLVERGEPLGQKLGAVAPCAGQLAELVRLAGDGLGVTTEVDAHPRRA